MEMILYWPLDLLYYKNIGFDQSERLKEKFEQAVMEIYFLYCDFYLSIDRYIYRGLFFWGG